MQCAMIRSAKCPEFDRFRILPSVRSRCVTVRCGNLIKLIVIELAEPPLPGPQGSQLHMRRCPRIPTTPGMIQNHARRDARGQLCQ
jgi:hypothetical protein